MDLTLRYAIFLPVIALSGFSGTVLGSESQTKNSGVIKLTSSDIRTYHQGDAINYTSFVAGSGIALTGTLKQSISNTVANPSGKKCLEHAVSTTYTGIGGPTPLNVRLLYYQDKQNSLYECGFYDNKTSSYVFITDTPNTPGGIALSIKSPMKVGNTTSNLITYTDGTWKDCTRAVQAIEDVDTTIGVYESYKITESCSNSADNSLTTTAMWFVPNIYTVKESGIGDIIAGDFVLDSFVFD